MIWREHRAQRPLAWLAVAALVAASLTACGASDSGNGRGGVEGEIQPVTLAPGARLAVVATTNIVGDVVSRVGGDRIDLLTLMDPGVDPHSYVPTPADSAAVHDADVVFISGAGLEASLERALEATVDEAVMIDLSEKLDLLPAAAGLHEEEKGTDHEDVDPHVWFSVPNVVQWVRTIEQVLSGLDPASAGQYRANAEAYVQELEELDAWIQSQVALIPDENRKLVTNHPAFGYLAQRYGLEQVGAIYPVNPSAEPSARDVAAIEDVIETLDVPAIFTESTVNPRLAQQVADDTGVRLVSLYTGSLGEPGSGAGSYIEMMRYDVSAIVEALQGGNGSYGTGVRSS